MHAILTKIISRNGVEISTQVLLTVLRIFLMALFGRIYFNVNEILPLVIICFQSSTWMFWSGSVIAGRNYMLVTFELWKKSFILTMYMAWLLYACDMLFLGEGGQFFSAGIFFVITSFVWILFHLFAIHFFALCRCARFLLPLQKLCRDFFLIRLNLPPLPPPFKNKMVCL